MFELLFLLYCYFPAISRPSYDNKFDIVVNITLIKIINAYENNAVFINFFPVLIFSSSPKLNFFINKPVVAEIAAAGVANAVSQSCTVPNAPINVEINFGYAAYECFALNKIKINTNIIL